MSQTRIDIYMWWYQESRPPWRCQGCPSRPRWSRRRRDLFLYQELRRRGPSGQRGSCT